MNRSLLTLLTLLTLSLACGQYTSPLVPVSPTPITPTDTATPLSPTRTHAVSTSTPTKQTALVVKTFVRIHAEPEGVVNGYVEYGDVLEIIQCEENWCEIKYVFENEEKTGYIFKGCLNIASNLGCLSNK